MKILSLAAILLGIFASQISADNSGVGVVHETPSLSDEQVIQMPETTIWLLGTDGLRFTARITADGRSFTIFSQLPSEFVISGQFIECDVYKA